MRIDLVTGATYSPIRTARNAAEPKVAREAGLKAAFKPGGAPLEGLSPAEMSALQKLFGDFKPGSGKEAMKTARPGQFIDITI